MLFEVIKPVQCNVARLDKNGQKDMVKLWHERLGHVNNRALIKERGMIHEFSSPYIHEQNGRAEREIRTIVECARSMLLSKNINRELWTEAIKTACYVLNRVILKHGEKKTPFEKWFNRKPAIKHLRIFGSVAYMHVPKEKLKKFDPKSKRVTVVGYDSESSNYRLWDEEKRKIFISSDVDFNESLNICHEKDVHWSHEED